MLAERFAALRAEGRRALVCYVTAGHPSPVQSEALIRGIAGAGADVIEVGVPFSDPVADGPTIQSSSFAALAAGMTFDGTLALASRARPGVPLVLFTYLNPLLAAGSDALDRARDAGFSGVLVTDLPVGADAERERRISGGPLDFVRLVAPTTPDDRMAIIGRHGSGFVYLISRLGVTGARADVPADVGAAVRRLRSACALPVCVGFGISTPAQAAEVARHADGVVVGSALVQAAGRSVDEAVALVAAMRAAMDRAVAAA
ncbi:MAG: tryptophan synthase subunit alpha [Gemmatimonadetes bacterium]|nr:tryptophan synthase subunit alpha [Gemmatimonadota bacterium]